MCGRPPGWRSLVAWIAVTLALASGRGLAADARAPEAPPATITNLIEAWQLPMEQKALVHPLRVEGRVSYYDPRFRLFWLEQNGTGTYLQLSASPPALRTGQHVVLEGTLLPDLGLSADAVAVKVLQEYEPVVPLDAKDRIRDIDALNCRIVTADAYVDGQLFVDVDHVRLSLIVENRPVIGWVKPADPRSIPEQDGVEHRALDRTAGGRDDPGFACGASWFQNS
jgi:hypothetical protein